MTGGSSSRSSSSASSAALHQHHQQQQQHQHQNQHLAAALRGRYDLLSVRGRGTFAEVWEARHRRTAHKVAIKIICHAKMEAQGLSIEKAAREISVMRLLKHHPHIICFYDAIVTHDHTYIVMELADAGQLHDHVVLQGRLPEDHARCIFRQLAAAVLYCHRNMVTHRDLKMENVLLLTTTCTPSDSDSDSINISNLLTMNVTNLVVKVVDFGFSKFYTKPMLRKLGSALYAAPELYGDDRYVGTQVDVWSCGVILYGMLCGGLPFDGADVSEIGRNVRRGEYRVPSWVSDDARDLIAGMLIVRPDKRMMMAEVMAHRWLQPDIMPAYLAMPPPEAAGMDMVVDEAAVKQLVTRHGYDRSSLLESLLSPLHHHQQQQQRQRRRRRRQQREQVPVDDQDDAAVAYQLVVSSMSDAATRYLSMLRPPEPEPESEQQQPPPKQWALGGLLDGGEILLGDCPRLTMQRIASHGAPGAGNTHPLLP